jgi:fido (protein-threonine AMPylation protein)
MSTEWSLENWRRGQVSAERMCLQLLSIEAFNDLDPQCPLGGPDGRKDILCSKNGWKYVAAAYFPIEKATKFKEIKDKFVHDLEGVKTNKVDGIVFLTGQKLTPAERKELSETAAKVGAKDILYHQERLIGLLDSPMGFAARLEFLAIPMRVEEQTAFVLALRSANDRGIRESIDRVEKKVDELLTSSASISHLQLKAFEALTTMASAGEQLLSSSARESGEASDDGLVSTFTETKLCALHRALMFERGPSRHAGIYRRVNVWIGSPGESPEHAVYTPPTADKVPEMMKSLLKDWNESFANLKSGELGAKIDAITAFHFEFLRIHPFLDGNGRASRFLIQTQAQELGIAKREVSITDRASHAKAIVQAHAGDLKPLRELIYQAVTGGEPES